MTAEEQRLQDPAWKKWGPYLSNRQWATVREDYSDDASTWYYVTYEQALSRAYRWGEDGIGGISDDQQLLCFAVGMWNGKDPIIKERLFGLTNPEGNHGEDVKELYYYLDNTPSHSYMKMLYKYPQNAFPYALLREENGRRGKMEHEFEIEDTGVFSGNEYFDVEIEYAKKGPDDILIRITAINRANTEAQITMLPTLWFRNTWAWGIDNYKPQLSASDAQKIRVRHKNLPSLALHSRVAGRQLFCDNETNFPLLFNVRKRGYFKDAINNAVVNGNLKGINKKKTGTKASYEFNLTVPATSSQVVELRLCHEDMPDVFSDFDNIFSVRKAEANEFFEEIHAGQTDADIRNIQRQALAGMLWNKQFYHFNVDAWIKGDPAMTVNPARKNGRNHRWMHLRSSDIISMPDKWEYPWYAAWDLAFHCIPLAMLDLQFAKEQLLLLTRERYMHPNGQLPAYEWDFGDVNPPVHAWAAWKVFKMERKKRGAGDLVFLESIFHKLLLNFTWWVNRKDTAGNNIFQGGFLGLDNIGVFDRNSQLPNGGYIEQADGTSWMAMFSLNMLRIAMELSKTNPVYQDMATKFFEHFLYIAGAMADMGDSHHGLWDEHDGFFYDQVRMNEYEGIQLKVRSMVGLIPLFAVEVLDNTLLQQQTEFSERMEWFLKNRPDLSGLVSQWEEKNENRKQLLSLLGTDAIKKLLHRMLDETEFLSDYGIRSLSKYHETSPYTIHLVGNEFGIAYTPGESTNDMFGGNSNWRGPVWMPLNYMLVESLRKFHFYYGDSFTIECPTGSGNFMNLNQVSLEITKRLSRLFLRNAEGRRTLFGNKDILQTDPNFRDHIMFFEYFHGDTGRGLGATQQTGWTGLIADLLRRVKDV
jgi:hypothetical protein